MKNLEIKKDAGFIMLAIRLVVGWTYFSAFWRRVVLVNKLDPEVTGYIGEKFNHFLPNAFIIKPIIQYLVENPEVLWTAMVSFTIIEGIVGLLLMLGFFTRLMSIGVFSLALGILLGSGWIGTTCLDEWQIGSLGIASGLALFLAGGGKMSLDNYFIHKNYAFTQKKWFKWLGTGELPIGNRSFMRIGIIAAFFAIGMTLLTNQVFHNGLWGDLHNKSVKPKIELAEASYKDGIVSLEVYRVEGADVYGSFLIGVQILDEEKQVVWEQNGIDLSMMSENNIDNKYVAKVKPGKHSLIIPLGAKAVLKWSEILELDTTQKYTVKLIDISGIEWSEKLNF